MASPPGDRLGLHRKRETDGPIDMKRYMKQQKRALENKPQLAAQYLANRVDSPSAAKRRDNGLPSQPRSSEATVKPLERDPEETLQQNSKLRKLLEEERRRRTTVDEASRELQMTLHKKLEALERRLDDSQTAQTHECARWRSEDDAQLQHRAQLEKSLQLRDEACQSLAVQIEDIQKQFSQETSAREGLQERFHLFRDEIQNTLNAQRCQPFPVAQETREPAGQFGTHEDSVARLETRLTEIASRGRSDTERDRIIEPMKPVLAALRAVMLKSQSIQTFERTTALPEPLQRLNCSHETCDASVQMSSDERRELPTRLNDVQKTVNNHSTWLFRPQLDTEKLGQGAQQEKTERSSLESISAKEAKQLAPRVDQGIQVRMPDIEALESKLLLLSSTLDELRKSISTIGEQMLDWKHQRMQDDSFLRNEWRAFRDEMSDSRSTCKRKMKEMAGITATAQEERKDPNNQRDSTHPTAAIQVSTDDWEALRNQVEDASQRAEKTYNLMTQYNEYIRLYVRAENKKITEKELGEQVRALEKGRRAASGGRQQKATAQEQAPPEEEQEKTRERSQRRGRGDEETP
ncbi:hypothetical protein BU26DRAFT_36596 [Trematosphaeria pertusa]|uniref:Uncharacterized protein n=1 Tax=Trematosphaeria pertusa TaxID=390896 RepID=A0A6A6J3B8_9PLEO|nr:uncharacterized protein BU26DRAFT_36596 [Trematosphaeria pertusa]KAF2257126.1 hypothetical protein BU26DRAFT_36596 [Trematosphaeria pertusa]